MRLLLTIVSIVFLYCPILSAQRQDDTSSVWNLNLQKSVVSAYERPSSMNASEQISKSQLVRFPVIADALRSLSGIQMKDYGGIGGLKTVNVRSLGSEHTGVYIDGLQVDNAQNMQVDLGRFSTDNLAYVDLYNGGRASTLQGAREYASGNSLYLTTLRPEFLASDVTNAFVRLRMGSFNAFNPSVTVEHLGKRGHSLRLSSEILSSKGNFKFHRSSYMRLPEGGTVGYDTVMVRYNADIASFRSEAHLFSPSSSDAIWDVRAYVYGSDRGLPGPVVRRLRQTTADRQHDINSFLQAKWKREYDRVAVLLSTKLSYDRLHYWTNPEADPYSLPYDNTYRQSSAYMSSSLRYRASENLSLGAAADFQYTYLDADVRGFVYPGRYSGWGAVSASWSVSKVRVDASAVYNLVHDRFGNGSAENAGAFAKTNKTRSALTPSVSLTWNADPSLTFAGFVKRSYRMPTFNDLYYTLIGNVNLDPETAWQNSVSAQYIKKLDNGWVLESRGELYYNHVTDKIIATPTANQFRWSMYNVGNVHILGAELKTRVSKTIGTDARASVLARYSFQDSRDFTSESSAIYGNMIPYVSRHSGSVTGEFGYGKWDSSINYTITGKRWSTGAMIDDYLIHPWETCDVTLSRDFRNEGGRGVSAIINLNNILGEQYEFVQGYPMPGFNVMAGLRYDF